MSHPLLLSDLPFTTSTSSSSFTLPSTTTPEQAAQSGQHDQLREDSVDSVHPAHKCCHLVCHMSHPWLFLHAPSSMSTSSSSPTYPTTQREQPVHPAHLQDHSVDKLRHQESLWREDLQSGGNPRTTSPIGYEPKSLRLSQGSKLILEIHISYMMYRKNFENKVTKPRSPKKLRNCERLGTHGLADSQKSETSHFQSHMHFDDSAESTADSDLRDGELQRC